MEQGKIGETFKDHEDCPEMVVVPAGSFIMGSSKDETDSDYNEAPQHQVTIPKPFAVSKYEVTPRQFAAFIDETGYNAGIEHQNWDGPAFWKKGSHPVFYVSWNDAKAYVSWLSAQTGHHYRLLSEAEWEYAARAGTTTRYYFGNTISSRQANYDMNNYGTVEVDSYSANKFGLHDVHGNVWEWVEDCWHDNYEGAPTDGSAWVSDCDKEDHRVARGGSWYDAPRELRSAARAWNTTEDRDSANGFRVARTLKS